MQRPTGANQLGRRRRSIASFSLVGAFLVFDPSVAEAAPMRVAVLGPDSAPVLARIQRNVASMKLDAVHASVTLCTRDVVTRLIGELKADAAVCTDGDQIGVWMTNGERLVLKEAVVVQSADDRAQELAAARATLALSSGSAADVGPNAPKPSSAPRSFTIVAGGSAESPPEGSPAPIVSAPQKDAPPAPRKPPTERVTPRLVIGAGPAIAASRHGTSFAISAEAEIGVSRYVAIVPWLLTTPANRLAEAPLGTASFRPTIFGLGFTIPVLPPSSFFVPRLGTGYGILWMHVAPESAVSPGVMRKPEDLLAPLMYATAAGSVKVTQDVRVVAEGMFGVSSHEAVVRIGGERAARWGVPLASATMRAEWVLP
jgi:hypothetical protein